VADVSTVAGEEGTQWGRTAATTGLKQRARVLRDAEENQEEVSAIGFVAERRGKERELAGARWVSAGVGREESCGWFSVRIELLNAADGGGFYRGEIREEGGGRRRASLAGG
jgi:hypothetical protein